MSRCIIIERHSIKNSPEYSVMHEQSPNAIHNRLRFISDFKNDQESQNYCF